MRSTPWRVKIDSWNTDLALGALEHAAADRRVLAFGVLAHDHEVDVARLARWRAATGCRASGGTGAGSRTGRSGGGTGSASPTATRGRAPWRASRPRRRRSPRTARSCVEPVLRHHAAVLRVVVAAPVEVRELEVDAELASPPPRARAGPRARPPCRCRPRGITAIAVCGHAHSPCCESISSIGLMRAPCMHECRKVDGRPSPEPAHECRATRAVAADGLA